MARPFVTELPTTDAWAVIRDLLDGNINDYDLALRTLNDVMSYASYIILTNMGTPLETVFDTSRARAHLNAVAEGKFNANPKAIDWKAILALLLKFITDWLNK